MPEIASLVDVEALVVAHLEQDAELGALVGGIGNAARVATNAPAGVRPPAAVQVFRVAGTTLDPESGHIERAVIQANAYAPTKGAAWDVFSTLYRALLRARTATHALGVVTAVERISGPTDSPDPLSSAPRYTGSFAVTVHPAPAS